MRIHVSSVFAVAGLLALASRAAFAATDAGQVLTFNGDCFVVAADQRTVLKRGDTIHAGDAVDVPQAAKLKLRMEDGSILSLGSGSHMTIQTYDVDAASRKRTVKLGLDSGLLHAIVAEAPAGSAFEVDTPVAVATTRSTDWYIESDIDKTVVSVVSGSVAFAAREPRGGPAPGGVVVAANAVSEIDVPAAAPPAPGKRAAVPRLVPTPPRPATAIELAALNDRASVSFGWCQCIADFSGIRATCLASIEACKASCGGGKFYSFIPDARLSCARLYADTPAPAPAVPPAATQASAARATAPAR